MKTYISTITLSLSTASSVLAHSKNRPSKCNLPSIISANGQEFLNPSEFLYGRRSPGTTCNDGNYESIGNVKSAQECGTQCMDKGDLSSSLGLYGYDYNCDTGKCDCLYGTQWEDIREKIKPSNEKMACYMLEQLPSSTSVNGQDYVFDREYLDGSSSTGTTCSDGTYESIENIKSAHACAVQCVNKGDLSSSLKFYGYDYNYDKQKCDCLYGTRWEDIGEKIKPSNENMACYGLEQDDEDASLASAFVTKSYHNQCSLPSSTYINGRDYTFDREDLLGSNKGTTCNDGNYESIDNIESAQECGTQCVYKGDLSSSLKLHGYDYNCGTQKCDCLYGTQWEDIEEKIKPSNENMACYGLEQSNPVPTPVQCSLLSSTYVNGQDYVFDREYLDGSSSPGTTCNDGNYESIDNVESAQECGIQCVYKGDLSSSLKLHGYDYNCDAQTCDCLYGTQWEDIEEKIEPSNENMACYGLEQDDDESLATVLTTVKKYLRSG